VMINTDFAIECTHNYPLHFRNALSIKLIAAIVNFLNRSVKNLNLAASVQCKISRSWRLRNWGF
jgi:hypothetical protein